MGGSGGVGRGTCAPDACARQLLLPRPTRGLSVSCTVYDILYCIYIQGRAVLAPRLYKCVDFAGVRAHFLVPGRTTPQASSSHPHCVCGRVRGGPTLLPAAPRPPLKKFLLLSLLVPSAR